MQYCVPLTNRVCPVVINWLVHADIVIWAREVLVDIVICLPWSHQETAGKVGEITALITPVLS